jgi:hypothetical protein
LNARSKVLASKPEKKIFRKDKKSFMKKVCKKLKQEVKAAARLQGPAS